MKSFRLILIPVLLFISILPASLSNAASQTPQGINDGDLADIERAFSDAAQSQINSAYPVPLYDTNVENIELSSDPQWASAWLVMTNPQSGEVIPAEPMPALAYWDGTEWNAVYPFDNEWAVMLASAPPDIQEDPTITSWLVLNIPQPDYQLLTAIGGYFLPWEGGRTVYLSRSVAHDGDFTSGNAHYSFDFYVPQTMYNIHAAKAGTVWMYKDSVTNNDHNDVNYLVLQDTSTNPITYQLYLHLAQNSIPTSLKTIGAPVAQGQFIGVADNTGQSTGHHLHFQVESEPYWTYWGRSVDITFNDVDINGGRPRVSVDFPYCTWTGDVCTVARSSYVSGNYPHTIVNPPYGDITFPKDRSTVNTGVLTLEGWAQDPDKWVSQARFIASYGASWQQIGPAFSSSPFTYQWDLCSAQVPDGPVSLALQIQDADGNWAGGLPGLKNIIKDFQCPPPPTCVPSANQVALYSDTDYRGKCALFSTGTHTSPTVFGELGVDNAASLRVGANVMTTLYIHNNLRGRGETFFTDDSSLGDNVIGFDTVSSLKVQSKSTSPSVPIPTWPAAGSSYAGNTSQSLGWEDAGGAKEFQIELDGVRQNWITTPYKNLGSLSPGTHSWRVRASNDSGLSGWSSTSSLSVSNPETQTTLSVPFMDDMENGYNQLSGSSNWDQTLEFNRTSNGQVSWKYEVNSASIGYDNGLPNSGDLTSPRLTIPSTGYFLRFWYLYETEGTGLHLDQRWVQLSVNGWRFVNILQLSNDPPNVWLQSPAIDLSTYAGSTIQIRFHFDTFDSAFNTNKGWFIDDFSINQTPPTSCSDPHEPDNSTALSRTLTYNSSLSGMICPGGDIDYFKFTALPGKTGIATLAQGSGSTLDTHIFLLDNDGKSVIQSNDDQLPGERIDSYLSYELTPGRSYYLLLQAWDHPSAGGNDHSYTLQLFGNDFVKPTAVIASPISDSFLPSTVIPISVSASDDQSGVSRIEFYWHPGDWQYSEWIYLGTDWEGGDGWSLPFDPSSLTEQLNIAFIARVYDWAGNHYDAAIWNLGVDRTPPVTSVQSLSTSQTSTIMKIQWNATDNLSGVAYVDLQQKTDSGSWQNWLSNIPAENNVAWFVGSMGHSYSFRMRGMDWIGNLESYPSSADATTSIPTAVCSSGDTWENDNTVSSARLVSGTNVIQIHNYCNPSSGSGWINDQDWLRINVQAGKSIIVHSSPQNNGVSSVLQLFASNGTTLLAENRPQSMGQDSFLMWRTVQDTTLYLRVTPLDNRISGSSATYQLTIQTGYPIILPIIRK